VGIYRFENYGGVGAVVGTGDSNDILIGVHQSTVGSHHGNLTGYLQPLTQDAQAIGDYVANDKRIEFLPRSPTNSGKGVSGDEDYASLALNYSPVLLGEFMDIGDTEADNMAYHDYSKSFKGFHGPDGGIALCRCDQYGFNTQCLCPLPGNAEHLLGILAARVFKVDSLCFHRGFELLAVLFLSLASFSHIFIN